MTDLRKAAEMALEALEWNYGTDLENIENCTAWLDKMNATIPALRQALVQPEQSKTYDAEDITAVVEAMVTAFKLRREWVGLTDEEANNWGPLIQPIVRSIEAKLKEKNT